MMIRPLNPQRELDAYLRVAHQSGPFPRSPAEWWERERTAPERSHRRHLVGEVDGHIVAIGALLDDALVANGATARVVVDTAHRRRGHGSAMAAALDALVAERSPDVVDVRVDERDAASRAWAEHRGFRPHTHTIRSRLELATFDLHAHRERLERARSAGYGFEPPADPDRLYDLYAALIRDVPDEYAPPTREWFRRRGLESPDLLQVVAIHGS